MLLTWRASGWSIRNELFLHRHCRLWPVMVEVLHQGVPSVLFGRGQLTAIPLPIKLYVALRVGVAVILSQRPTPGTIEYSTNRFCGETYVLAGVLKSQVFKLCFGVKSFVPGKKLAKLRKEEDWRSQPAPTVGPTAPTVGPMQVSVHREIFNFSWRVAKSVLSSTVRRWNVKKKRKNKGKERLWPKAKRKDFFSFSQGFVFGEGNRRLFTPGTKNFSSSRRRCSWVVRFACAWLKGQLGFERLSKSCAMSKTY